MNMVWNFVSSGARCESKTKTEKCAFVTPFVFNLIKMINCSNRNLNNVQINTAIIHLNGKAVTVIQLVDEQGFPSSAIEYVDPMKLGKN